MCSHRHSTVTLFTIPFSDSQQYTTRFCFTRAIVNPGYIGLPILMGQCKESVIENMEFLIRCSISSALVIKYESLFFAIAIQLEAISYHRNGRASCRLEQLNFSSTNSRRSGA